MNGTLIYDGDCPMCRKAVAWVDARAMDDGFEKLPCQSRDRASRFPGMKESECMRAMQLVLADGTRYSGAEALPHILLRVRGWRFLARVLRLPVISWFSPLVYSVIARNRQTISLLVREKPADESCTDDVCEIPSKRP